MKLKNLKKVIKKTLFNKSMSQNLFMIFEINNTLNKKLQANFESITFLSKQILNNSLCLLSKYLKYPVVVKSISSLIDVFNYISYLSNKNLICNVFFVKIHFLLFKKNVFKLLYISNKKNNLILMSELLVCLIKKKKLLKLCHTLICPFINLDSSTKNLLNK